MKYDIVAASYYGDLVKKVNALLEKGWKPLGPPYKTGSWTAQALTKEAPPEKEVKRRLGENK